MPLHYRFLYYIAVIFLFVSCSKLPQKANPRLSTTPTQTQKTTAPEPVVLNLGTGGLTKSDLINSLVTSASLDSGTNAEILSELLQRKLFVAEARALGMDTIQNFKEQVETHTKLALADFLEDKSAITALGNEAYDRYLKEINASHIFVPISEYASPADTLKLYSELLNIRDLAVKNKDFETQAKRWSKDTKTATNGGSLGWFSVFNLIYPLETVVYNTPKDSISRPVRTKFGYHIVRVNDTRKNSGTVKVQHIWKQTTPDMPAADLNRIYSLLDSLRNEIEKGAKFEDMVLKYSDDFNSREIGGELTPFGVGTRTEASFEDVAFSLKKGEISKPFQSSSGFHIIRLIDSYKPETKSKFLESNRNKLTTDSRAEFLLRKRINQFRSKNKVQIKNDVFENAMKFSSVRILGRNWQKPSTVILTDPLLTINEKTIPVKDFYGFVEERQEFEKWPSDKPNEIFNMLFEKFLNAEIIKYQEEVALKQNPDVEQWVKNQSDNILYLTFLDRYVLEKSAVDTVAQKQFFEKNKQLFTPNELGSIAVMSYANEETFQKFKALAGEPKPYKLYRGITPLYYAEDEYKLNQQDERKLYGLVSLLSDNPSYIVEVGGHVDAKEDENVSELRLRQVVNFLVKNGVPLKRILEVNYKSSVIHDRFDWSKNQVVTFQFFSNAEADLVKTFNSKNENAIVYDTFTINKADFESKMKTTWGNKTGIVKADGRIEEYTLRTKKNRGTYQDYKTDVILKYQEYLKSDLEKRLATKFKVNYDSAEINSLINELKKKN